MTVKKEKTVTPLAKKIKELVAAGTPQKAAVALAYSSFGLYKPKKRT